MVPFLPFYKLRPIRQTKKERMYILGGTLKGRKLHTPSKGVFRPSLARTRAMVFNICQHEIEQASFLDLFAGTGAMGFEALSRGAKSATFVDLNRFAIEAIQKTTKELSLEKQVGTYALDVLKALSRLNAKGETYSLVYMDPPYFRQEEAESFDTVAKALIFLNEEPILPEGGVVFVEDALNSPLDQMNFSSLDLLSKRRCGEGNLWQFVKRLYNQELASLVDTKGGEISL